MERPCNEWVGLSGFEPELRRPKCLVLPLHHSPIQMQIVAEPAFICARKDTTFLKRMQEISRFLCLKYHFLLNDEQIVLLFPLLGQQIFAVKQVICRHHLIKGLESFLVERDAAALTEFTHLAL